MKHHQYVRSSNNFIFPFVIVSEPFKLKTHTQMLYATHLLGYWNVICFQIIKKKRKKTYRIPISETTFDGILKICFVQSRWSKSRKKSTRVFYLRNSTTVLLLLSYPHHILSRWHLSSFLSNGISRGVQSISGISITFTSAGDTLEIDELLT